MASSGTRSDQNRRRVARQVVRRSSIARKRRPRLKYSARRRVALLLILARVVVDRDVNAVVQTPERHQAVRLLDRHALHVLGTAVRVRRRWEKRVVGTAGDAGVTIAGGIVARREDVLRGGVDDLPRRRDPWGGSVVAVGLATVGRFCEGRLNDRVRKRSVQRYTRKMKRY